MRKKLQWWGVTRGLAGAAAGLLVVSGALAGLVGPASAGPTARIVFRGGPIYTADPAAPKAEAVAVGDQEILYVGSEAGVRPFITKNTRVIDLKGQALFPGFIDSNARLYDYARSRHLLDLTDVRTYDDLVRRVARAARQAKLPGDWILGWGWNQNDWPAGDPIRMTELQASGSHPVCLYHATDDAVLVNGVALEVADLADGPPDPPGGRFLRMRGGTPTGVLVDAAVNLIAPVLPKPAPDEVVALYHEAAESCAVHGITQVHEMDLSLDGLQALDEIARSREGLPVRVWGVLADERGALEALQKQKRKEGGPVEVRAVGLKVDGSLDTRGAALGRPYLDEGYAAGYFCYNPPELPGEVGRIMAAGYQPVLRATGDEAVRIALDAIAIAIGDTADVSKPAAADSTHRVAAADSTHPAADSMRARNAGAAKARPAAPAGQLPPRIESAAVIAPDDMARFPALGVVASMQPARVSYDYSWIEDRLGIERPARAYAWRSLMTAGASVIFGSGAPAAPLDPLRTFYAAITRKSEAGRPAAGWTAGEKLTREEALQAMTRLPAAAISEEKIEGSIGVGKRADLVVLSRDIMQVPEKDILSTRVAMTVVGGRIVHEKMSNP